MKKWIVLTAALVMIANAAWAAKAAAKTTASKPTPVQASASADDSLTAAQRQIETMTPGLAYNFSLDVSLIDMYNMNFANTNQTSSWYYYPVYRAIVTDVFQHGFGVTADIEKPGYAGLTYPTIKVNELYGKYKMGNFYYKLGRQIFGDPDDLILGLQSDAVAFGMNLENIDLEFFYAHSDVVSVIGTMDGTIGLIPTFTFSPSMGLRGYLLIETQPITVTSGGTTSDKTNSIIFLGAKYYADLAVGSNASIAVGAQPAIQFALAQDAAARNIDATSFGIKADGTFKMAASRDFGFKAGAHMIFTGGDPDVALNTKAGFCSTNELVGSGPGLFDKVQDGAGPYTFVDTIGSSKLQQYAGVFAFGLDAGFDVLDKTLQPGLALWFYSDTDTVSNVKSSYIGTEFDETVVYHLNEHLSFYQQLGVMMPNPSYHLPTGGTDPSLGMGMKFVLGTKLEF
ncbi:MAG: hypothetical protein HGA76_01455 [Candidatus Firestonebacteria bacterium]|nr:hypothetical protein [Candidatus Firestonebacteria bacterium]